MSDSLTNPELTVLSQADLEVFKALYAARAATPTDLAIQMKKMTEEVEPCLVNLTQLNLAIVEERSKGLERGIYKLSRKGIDFGEVLTNQSFSSVDHTVQLSNLPNEVHRSAKSKLKRFIDIVGGLIGILILGIILLPVAIAIKLDSPGPIFYRENRVGLGGRIFKLWKFRTLVADADSFKQYVSNEANTGVLFKNRNDPRVTRVGRFLHKSSLNEIPQFWNVLKGDMSLVGITAPTIDEVMNYDKPEYWQRLTIKPGMTGEVKVRGGRSALTNFEDVIAMDLNYQRKWSIGYDFKILAMTLLAVSSRGAY